MTTAARSAGRPAAAGPAIRTGALALARAAAAPLVAGLVLIILLASWVLGGGGGTVSRVRIRVTQAAVPMISFTSREAAGANAPVYLTLENLADREDVLLAASSPAAARVMLTRGPTDAPAAGAGLAIPAGKTVSLSPFGPDLVLVRPRSLLSGQQVLLRLRFRNAGLVTAEASVTPPGTT